MTRKKGGFHRPLIDLVSEIDRYEDNNDDRNVDFIEVKFD